MEENYTRLTPMRSYVQPGGDEAHRAPLLRVLSELRMPLVTAVAADRAAATRWS